MANLGSLHYHDQPYDGYFENPEYVEHSLPGPNGLPSGDFNKQVYHFNDQKQIWNQENYAERLKVEAEIMVTLEALKT